MGKFSGFSGEWVESEAREPKEKKWFEVGIHNVTIEEVEDRGPSKPDPTWFNYKLTLVQGEKKTYTDLLVPTEHGWFKDEGATWAMEKLQRFCTSAGIASKDMGKVLEKYFENPAKLKGLNVQVKTDYNGVHAVPVGKSFNLVDAKKKVIHEGLSSREECEQLAKAKGLFFVAFPRVVDYGEQVKQQPKAAKKSEEVPF